jgi:uncharacterized protein YqeY
VELEKKVMDMLKEAIILAKTEKNAGEMTAEKELQLIQKLAKQRKESFEIYQGQGMIDLATKEKEELDVLEKFLPKQLSEEEVKPIIAALIAEMEVINIKEMGKVIGAANKKLAGQADGGVISRIVKELLTITN